jgi:hypothetical protein
MAENASEEQTPQEAERVCPMKVISISGIYLAITCWCLYVYYIFISKTNHREFTIFLPLSMIFLVVSLYARKQL